MSDEAANDGETNDEEDAGEAEAEDEADGGEANALGLVKLERELE